MTIELSEQQRRDMEAGTPVEVSDEHGRFYVVSKVQFDLMKARLEAERIDPSLFEFRDEVLFREP
jgi:hypothetical protein